MAAKKKRLDRDGINRVVAEARSSRQQRLQGYREQALKIFPRVCARCGREFEGKRLRELTVHHKDHNHENNPPDGSNWELLCIYCHDEEHSKFENLVRYGSTSDNKPKPATYNPFADLRAKMEDRD